MVCTIDSESMTADTNIRWMLKRTQTYELGPCMEPAPVRLKLVNLLNGKAAAGGGQVDLQRCLHYCRMRSDTIAELMRRYSR